MTPTREEATRAAFDRAQDARTAIEEIIGAVRSGTIDLPAAFDQGDANPLMGRCFAVKVFEALPDIGKVRARRTMEEIGLAEDVWLRNVPERQRTAIMAAFNDPDYDGI